MKTNKGFTPIILLLTIVGVLVVGGGSYYLIKNSTKAFPEQNADSNVLPNSFTMEVYANNSSSGADRVYNGELTFKDDELIDGFQNYKVSQGGDCTTNCEKYTECIIKDQQWVDKNDDGECKIETFILNTKEGIRQQIKNKGIVQSDDFVGCHYSTCYRIKNSKIKNNFLKIPNINKIVSGVNSKIKDNDTCPPLAPQQAEMYEGKPLPGKYKFVLDFNLNGFECKGNSWGGDFPGCDNWVPVITTPWHAGDVVNSCFSLYEDEGFDTGWGIGLVSGSNIRVPLRYVKKVPDTTPITK